MAVVYLYEETIKILLPMKKFIFIVLCVCAAGVILTIAQPGPSDMPPPTANGAGKYIWVAETNTLPKFDLEFSGGTPQQLVDTIEKVTDKPLNTVIPDDCRDLEIPAFSVKNVTVAQLFGALGQMSKKDVRYIILEPESQYTTVPSGVYAGTTSYGFKTEGIPTESSIWYFYWERGSAAMGNELAPWQVLSSTVCNFYQLDPYLEAGYKVDDITTAVGTAWKMLGITNPPAINYHKETKLLIVVGKQDQVDLVADVLKQLQLKKPKPPTEKTGN